MLDETQIGRYGTISLLKRKNPPTVITAFGIDTQELTFGRDRDCSVRLYYPDIDPIHCKIVFEERKAFLVVYGKNGLLIDGCLVYPNPSPHGAQTTIPLTNNSEMEIHNKRFRFTYPPKELRAVLFASPQRPNRAPRLSMIRSAQVFSPQAYHNPEENLRVLQSPLKSSFLHCPLRVSNYGCNSNTGRCVSPTKRTHNNNIPEGDLMNIEEEHEILLVEGDHPRIVEEEKDLVILEDVEMTPPSSPPILPGTHTAPTHFSMGNSPQTPHRRPNSRESLHRAVLIRSAQRAVSRAQKEDDELEEIEVLSAVASDDDFELNDGDEDEKWDQRILDQTVNMTEDDVDEGGYQELMDRRSHEILPTNMELSLQLQGSQTVEESEPARSTWDDLHETHIHDQNFNGSGPKPIQERIDGEADGDLKTTSIPRYLGDFMTPQPLSKRQNSLRRNLFGMSDAMISGNLQGEAENTSYDSIRGARYSVDASGPRRVLLGMPWRVKDLVVPLKTHDHQSIPLETVTTHELFPLAPGSSSVARSNTLKPMRKSVDERERKAIQERRRSALREVDSFFAGGIPGMGVSPTKNPYIPLRQSWDLPDTPNRRLTASREEGTSFLAATKEEEDDDLDTKSLLEKMKVTVEEMKKRRSTTFTPISSFMGHGEPELASKEDARYIADIERHNDQVQETGSIGMPGHKVAEHVKERSGTLFRQDVVQSGFSQRRDSLMHSDDKLVAEVVVDPLEGCSRSFSQLMRSESPHDLEQHSDDIRDILEQDITLRSETAPQTVSSPSGLDMHKVDTSTIKRSTRSSSRITSAEPESKRESAKSSRHTEQPKYDSDDMLTGDTRNALRRECPSSVDSSSGNLVKHGQMATLDDEVTAKDIKRTKEGMRIADEVQGEFESRPTPVPRVTRASKRGRTIAAMPNSKQRNEKDDSNGVEAPASTRDRQPNPRKGSNVRIPAPNTRGIPRKANEGTQEASTIVVTRKTRNRSATLDDGRSNVVGNTRTPTTRNGGRRAPATVPLAAPVEELEELADGDKENTRDAKLAPEEGTRVRISRNKTTVNNAASRSGIKFEEDEAKVPRRATRARTRTKV